MYEQKIGGLYSGSVGDSCFVKTHEEVFIRKGAPVVTVARDLGECLCSAADYAYGGSLRKTLAHWENWFGGIENFFRTLERLDALIIRYNEIEDGMERMLERFQIEPDIQLLSTTEWNNIVVSNQDHFISPMRQREQVGRIEKANRMIQRRFPEIQTVCKRIGWTPTFG